MILDYTSKRVLNTQTLISKLDYNRLLIDIRSINNITKTLSTLARQG